MSSSSSSSTVVDVLTLPPSKIPRIALPHRGDITRLKVDAIVNAANKSLINTSYQGNDVDAAIHRAAGPEQLVPFCKTLGGCEEEGQSKISPSFNLSPAIKFIIHTVGPVGRFNKQTLKSNDRVLASCYTSALDLCLQHQIHSVAFPCIAAGVHGFPSTQAAQIAIKATSEWLDQHMEFEIVVVFCVFSQRDATAYQLRLG